MSKFVSTAELLRRRRQEEENAGGNGFRSTAELVGREENQRAAEAHRRYEEIQAERRAALEANRPRIHAREEQPTRNTPMSSIAPWADKNSANSLPSTYEMYKKNLRDPKVQQDYQTKSEATKLLSDAAGKMQYSTSEIKTSLEKSKEAAAKKGENTAAYDKALEMLTEYSNNNAYKTPEELQKEIDSTPFDYHNKEDIKKALGAGENQDELADYYMKYRAGIISSSDGRDDAKYKGLNELIEPRVLNTSVQKSTDKSHEVAYTGEDGKSVNYGTLIAQRVSENRKSDLTASKEKAGATLGYLGSGNRNLTNGYKASTEDMRSAGWDSQYTYAAYQVDGDTEQKSAVFSPVVLNEKGEVQKILTPDELEKYAKESLSSDSDPLHLQATETYNGFYGTSLARENAKRINRLSERYFNDTDLEGLVAATNNTTPGTTPESREEAKAKAAQYGVDLDELEHYGYIETVKSKKEKASKAYANWSDENDFTGAVATGANIVASPLKAVEYGINLGESLHDVGKANENGGVLSSYKIPPTYDDFFTSLTGESTEAITEGIRKSIKGDGDNPFLNWLGDTAANTYGGVTSSVQSALTGATARALFGPGVGEAVALGIMSGEAANDAFNDVIDNGGTVGQAVTYSIAAGANEAIFEKVSLENLINIKDVVGKKGVKEALKSVITQGFTEASEEVNTELANRFADDVINTDKSEYNRNVQKYIDQGYSEDEAKSKANMDFVGQVMLAGYGGFIGGGFSAGGKVAINTVQENRQSRNTGAAITGAGNTQALIDKAKNSTDESVQKQAEKVEQLFQTQSKKNEKTGKEKSSRKLNKEAGTLYDMLQEREIEDTQSPLRTLHDELSEKIIAETGSENEEAVNVIMKSQLNRGADLTGSEQALLDTPVMQKIVNDSQDLFRKASESTAQAWQSMGETSALMQKTNQDYDTFDPTDDGLTYINGQNTPVEVSRITAVTGNNYDVELKNGETVKASKLDFGDSAVPAILSGMLDTQEKHGTQMSPEFVNSAVKLWQEGGYNSGSLNGYITDAQEAFYAGNSNNTEYKPKVMSQGAYDALYKAAAETKSAAITAKGTQIETNKTATRREGTVIFESADGTNISIASSRDVSRRGIHLNDLQKVGIDMVTNLAKSTGLTFHFFQSKKNAAGKYVHEKHSARDKNGNLIASPNGFYKNGEIYVDINAGSNGEGLIMFTVSHELVHFMRDFAPEQFDKFAGFLFASYAKKGLSVRHAVHQEMMAHQSLKYDEAYEEVVARLSESFLRDAHLSEKSKALYNADKSLWQSIKDGLEKVINKIKESFASISPESQLGKIGQKMVRENQDILDRFVAGIREAADNAEYTENTTESEKGNTTDKKRLDQSRDDDYLSAVNRGDMETAQRMVDESAERAFADSKIRGEDGKLIKVYHGTDADFNVFDLVMHGGENGTGEGLGIYLTDKKNAASAYGNRLIESYANVKKPAKAWEKTITKSDFANLIRAAVEKEAHEMVENEGYDSFDEAKKDTWISNFVTQNDLADMDNAYRIAAEKLDRDNDRDIIRGLSYAIGAIWDNQKMVDFYRDVVTPTIGVDGFWVRYKERNGEYTNVILAFDSAQIKSADPVTYDDNGDVIPLSQRFNSEKEDIRYDEREGNLFEDDDLSFGEYDDISDVIKRQYITHSEAIGEVLKNTADIDIAAGKVKNIVSRLLNARFSGIDQQTKKTLAIRLQAELENAKKAEPQDIVNNMIDAVRGVLDDAKETDDHAVELYDELKEAFSGRYYLTDEQLMDLQENGETLNSFKKAMMGKMTIINKDNGGVQGASKLSLEGIFDLIDAEEIFGINRDQWDEYGYHAPVMLMEAFQNLKDNQEVPLSKLASSDDMDYIATQIAAEFTGAVVQEKYNSRKNPYVKELVNKFEARKKEAVKKRNAYYKERMAEIREQRDKKIAEQVKKTKEARKSATVQRKRSELKERIRKMHKSLSDMALNPKVKKYIPSDLLNQSIDVMAAVNLDSGLQGERADKFRQKLRDLSHTLLKLKSESGDAEIDAALSSMLDNLSDRVGNTPLGKMSLDQLKMVHDTLKAVQTNIRNRIEVIGAEKTRYIYDVAFKMIGEIDDAKVRKILGSKYVTTQLSTERFFNMICGGAKNNAGLEIYRMLDDGQLKQIELETRFARMFEDLVNDKRAKELSRYGKEHLVDIGLVDEQGNKVKITRGMMLSLYMHLMNDDNIRHVMGGGLSVPFLKSYYTGKMDKAFGSKLVRVRDSTSTARDIAKQIEEKRGEINDDTPYEQKQKIWDEIEALEQAYDAEVQRGIEEYINPMRTRIEKQLTDYDKEWIKTAKQFFDVESKNELNKTTMELYGFEKAVVKNYFPIHSDTAFTEQKFETIVRDMSLENLGMMKSRVGSANPIFLEDITDVINKQISNVAQYCGMVIPMANVKRILNVKGSNSSTSVMATLRKYDGKAKSYIDKLLGDLVGANKEESDPFSNLLAKARHGLAGAALTMNLKVAIKQAASYPTAAAELGYIPLAKALVKGGKNNWALSRADKELIYKYSPLLAYRSMGYFNQELGDLKDSKGLVDKVMNNPKLKWAFGWIQAMDTATVGRLWYASQYYVDKSSPDLKKGSDEYYKEVARVFNNVVERTQPNYTVLQRPQLLRSTNSVTKMFTMFLTQRLQNFNIVYNAGITLSKMKSDFKNGKNGVTIQDVKQAKLKMARAVSSQLLSVGVLVGMTFLADAIIHKMNPWRDDDDELTGESVGIRALMYLGESLAGSVWGGSEVFDAISSYLTGGTWYGISANGIDTLQDLTTNIYNFANKKNWKNAEKLIKSLSQYAGIPYQNAKNIVEAVMLHTEDIQNGQFLSYEAGVSRTAKINAHRAWSAYNLGKYSDSKAIIKEMKDSAVQAQLDKGKNETQAKKDGYSSIRTTIRNLLRVDYLKARQNYYHGSRNEDDYKKIASITNFMTSAEVYEKPDVKKTLENWWNDAEKKAKENEMTMKEYLNTL